MATREQLLDSVAHKLRLARYHAHALLDVLELNPPDVPEDPRRIELEAHLEGLAYSGTAAVEKTIRAVAPDEIQDQARVEQMLAVARRRNADVAGGLARWWQDGARELPKIARELRNDAAHSVYEKRPLGPIWVLEIDRRDPIPIGDFAREYGDHLTVLTQLSVEVGHAALPAEPAA